METIDMVIYIIPFIIGLVGVALIPKKEILSEGQISSEGAGSRSIAYLIGVLILVWGIYYFFSILINFVDFQQLLILLINGLLLCVIGVGIISINNKSSTPISDQSASLEARVEVAEVEVAEVSEARIAEVDLQSPAVSSQVACPKCGKVINVHSSKRPVKISCPNCGIEGFIE